ncbi:ribonuclease HI [Thermoanaerobacterium thermosaccharolyticum]|jgi:ribonuclease HI|uniref:Ribonuclease H n=1 Tax=Thermoanaerobacterium thermosaccharolyticum (strain ATCC 7956 / DSM 571 / NCIMB 9385 / NCA 3814 / NCTC 13789 / WDCM 00135 / 2032) TaxID=580327 RepID=D9TTC1_THETC|nr:ribonuclease HI [Thermoanaerobacterium thermosaccharolyticum]ADL68887.1 Ribonuclease H [Thermoanaerobacterium thermosaccharolyticum DSM 571]KAA5807697.1 ribonuclease HI [Thermoanaerobacterium thermosaccharolyticum]TCW38610.1 ribonuclease HI [Thermohydrogenium kirishiense]
MANIPEIDIYTDGACSGNPGPGGWGAVLIYNGIKKEISGYEENTTNNRMELTAVIKALSLLKRSCKINIYSDSSYLINAFNQKWIENWQKRGWLKSDKTPVENKDLWLKLLDLSSCHDIKWIKVKGHSDNEYNNRCDKLATDEIRKHSI